MGKSNVSPGSKIPKIKAPSVKSAAHTPAYPKVLRRVIISMLGFYQKKVEKPVVF
jgi:hypothetical protein